MLTSCQAGSPTREGRLVIPFPEPTPPAKPPDSRRRDPLGE
jgi:hypothetical protein